MCRDPIEGNLWISSLVIVQRQFKYPNRSEWCFAFAEKRWAFMQSWQYPQPWFSVMRLISNMHETRRETADGRQGTRPAHYRALRYWEKKMNQGLAPHQSWSVEVHPSIDVCCAVDYISTTYKVGTYSSRCSRPVYWHTKNTFKLVVLAISWISIRQQGQGYPLGCYLR